MYVLRVVGHFSAAHFLRGYDGDCGRMHGHTWRVIVEVDAGATGKLGMALDFKYISRELDSIIARFDHRLLNDHEFFSVENPTAENIARYFHDGLSLKLNGDGITVSAVTVEESERYSVTYRPETSDSETVT